jgi:hypothetical protein
MAKTRDLAKTTLDRWIRHLENPDNLKDKTATELATVLLADLYHRSSFRKQGGQRKWRTLREFGLLIADIVAACDDVFVVDDLEFKIREGAKRLPPAEKIAYRLQLKFPSNPKYRIAPSTLTKQIQKALEFNQRLLGRGSIEKNLAKHARVFGVDDESDLERVEKVIDEMIARGKR